MAKAAGSDEKKAARFAPGGLFMRFLPASGREEKTYGVTRRS